jgi:hypothetical protein
MASGMWVSPVCFIDSLQIDREDPAMTPRRSVSLLAAAAIATLSVGLGVDRTAATPTSRSHGAAATGGHEALAVVTQNSEVLLARLSFHSQTIKPILIGPVTQPTTTHLIHVDSLVSSSDGEWLAWNEIVEAKKAVNGFHNYIRNFVVLRNEISGHTTSVLGHHQAPIGFAGDTLITASAHAKRFALRPTPHLIRIHDSGQVRAAYRHGVVDVAVPHSTKPVERLRLTSLSGRHVVLHNYRQTATGRSVATTEVSGDAQAVAVERGDHTDFGGVGPSSLVDVYQLSAGHSRTTLGHIGSAKAGWRVGTLSFSGPDDEVWAVWYKAGAHVRTRLARFVAGKWKVVSSGVITVAGNTATGDVVYQPGHYKPVTNDLQFVPVASQNAVIIHRGHPQILGMHGVEFAWVAH